LWGLLGSVVLITLWLFMAVGTWRLMVPILLTLALGLSLTLLFAAVAIGTLNLVSVGFGVLFIGIAVDFAIQFAVRYRERRHEVDDLAEALRRTAARTGIQILVAAVGTLNLVSVGFGVLFVGIAVYFAIQFAVRYRERRHEIDDLAEALRRTAARTGIQILVAAVATAAGFLAFVPTDFVGVAELGEIAGIGMLIAFVCTMTFLPAAITVFRPKGEAAEIGIRWAIRLDRFVRARRKPILATFAAAGVAAIVLSPHLAFDSNPLHTKNQNTEAVRTLNDLIASPITNPYTIDVMEPSAAAAAPVAAKLRRLPSVLSVRSIDSFIPQDQDKKLAILADAREILEPTLSAPPAGAPATPADIRLAAKTALAHIDPALAHLPPTSALIPLAKALHALLAAPDAVLVAANAALTR
ncbi:MAG: MMPL family transporter, partial [Acetobacteraceae bacterium]